MIPLIVVLSIHVDVDLILVLRSVEVEVVEARTAVIFNPHGPVHAVLGDLDNLFEAATIFTVFPPSATTFRKLGSHVVIRAVVAGEVLEGIGVQLDPAELDILLGGGGKFSARGLRRRLADLF